MKGCKSWFFIVLLAGFSCIDSFPIETDESEGVLIVEGFVSTRLKYQRVKLTRAGRFSPEISDINRPILNAKVLIKDNLGKIIPLNSVGSGFYESEVEFSAEIGMSYNLDITLSDGKRFISLPEKVMQVQEVDSLTYKAVRTVTTNRLNDEIGVEVTAHFQDPVDQVNYYYWKQIPSTYILVSEPELYHTPPWYNPPRQPWPLACCNRCFDTDIPTPFNIMTTDDFDFNGTYQRRPIAYVVDNGLRFKEIYRLDILHLSVSQEAQRFLRLADQQVRLTGSIFDPAPANIRGNMLSLQDKKETVLGFFFFCFR